MNDKERKQYIKTNWFKDHKAVLEQLSEDTTVLTWKKDGTNTYYVRYILDRNTLFITGDIGDAVFCLTEQANLKNIAAEYNLHYLFGKLRANSDAYDFNNELAIQNFISHFNTKDIDVENEDEFNELIDDVIHTINEECISTNHWSHCLSSGLYDRLSKYDYDLSEWISDIGSELSWQALGWVVGLQMAYDQLSNKI